MVLDINKTYEPCSVEEKWIDFWVKNKISSSKIEESRDPFCIVIPPPNVTGSLHMGHALNSTLQDITIRFKKMNNFNALWVPGSDHGGIATQNVVEKLLKAEGRTRHELGREKFLERMWKWRNETGDKIFNQLKKLGCSLDTDRMRFTMDEVCSNAVNKAFIELFNEGLIYRGKRLVNWCPRCNTALSDIEVEHEEEIGKLWHIQYPVINDKSKGSTRKKTNTSEKKFVIVATTRPETMLGDTAVAVHPKDKRYKKLIGKKILLPLMNREIPIVADDAVDPAFGTGAVKVTPAHDPTDFEIAQRNKLPHKVVIDFNGKMTKEAKHYEGLDRYEARKRILHDLESLELLLETVDHPHSIGRCYRCNSVIEPLVSEQWFVSVKDMSKKAMDVVRDGKVKFYPESWAKPYLLWLENLKDWCISRQIWWGHRIPVWYCKKSLEKKTKKNLCPPIASDKKPEICPKCKCKDFEQDPDVLDTWFSSALWPFSVFGWPEKKDDVNGISDLDYYYPTSVLVTGHEILYLWVARMVQMGLKFMGDVPFKEVFIHGIVRDKSGKKMAKSLGNVIDPLEIMGKYGTDALRFALTQSAAPGRDMQLSDDSFLSARNFANKIWNASRFIMMNLESVNWEPGFMAIWPLELADKWILSEYRLMINKTTSAIDKYNMDVAAREIYDFFWSKYCDWYIEIAKIRMNSDDENKKKAALSVLTEVLSGTLKVLHPIMPFITEEVWQNLNNYIKPQGNKKAVSIVLSSWPKADESKIDQNVLLNMKLIQEAIVAVRTIRSEMNVSPGKYIDVIVNVLDKNKGEMLKSNEGYIKALAKVENFMVGGSIARPEQSAVGIVSDLEIFVPLKGIIDIDKEKERLVKEIEKVSLELERCKKNLLNKKFVDRAPESEVDKMRARQEQAALKLKRLKDNLKSFGG